ncbi:MAG TPA: serine protease [Polyangiaceae bacterium]|nr:serine protease [Polyangiaceae bacterium]
MGKLVSIGFACLVGCGGAAPLPPAPPPPPAASARPPAPPDARAADHKLARSAVHAVVAQGLGAFLQHVDVDDHPVMSGGRFHGFRIAALRDAAFWAGVDLKPGDVVTSVNGLPIERPEQAQTAFDSLDVASELRVAFERDGHPQELVYAIVDDR